MSATGLDPWLSASVLASDSGREIPLTVTLGGALTQPAITRAKLSAAALRNAPIVGTQLLARITHEILNRLTEVVHGHRVHRAAVIAGDHEEVVEADAVLRTVLAL